MTSNATVNWLRSRLAERTDPKDGPEAKSPRTSGRKLIQRIGHHVETCRYFTVGASHDLSGRRLCPKTIRLVHSNPDADSGDRSGW